MDDEHPPPADPDRRHRRPGAVARHGLLPLLLAIPHLIVVSLWGVAAFAVSVILWLALLFEGRAPRSLQSFVARTCATRCRSARTCTSQRALPALRRRRRIPGRPRDRAGAHAVAGPGRGSPRARAAGPAARRRARRRRVLRRLAWATHPNGLGLGGWSAGVSLGGVARRPRSWAGSRRWRAAACRAGSATCRVRDRVHRAGDGYLLLVTDRYPTSDPSRVLPFAELPAHPVASARRSARAIAADGLLPAPARDPAPDLAPALGRARAPGRDRGLVRRARDGTVPRRLHRFLAAWVRYSPTSTPSCSSIGGPFPGFVGAEGSYPVDLAIDPPERQRRGVTLVPRLARDPRFAPRRPPTRRRSGRRRCSAGGPRSSPGACRRACATSAPSASGTSAR